MSATRDGTTLRPFETVVAEHGATVLRVCRAVLGMQDAEDAWSETFLSALTAYPDLAADANVEAWLVTIAQRKSVDVLRARSRTAITVETLPERESRIGIPGTWNHDLWNALADLAPKQRQAVAYHYLGGLPHRAIAEILGGTEAAARKAASDGIASLRAAYGRAVNAESGNGTPPAPSDSERQSGTAHQLTTARTAEGERR